MFQQQTADVAPTEREVAKIQVNSAEDLRLALETADRCVRFGRPRLATQLLFSAIKYTVAKVPDSAIVAYVAESLASVIVLDVLGDESLQSENTSKPVVTHKSFLNSSLDLLSSKVESRQPLKALASSQELPRLQIAKHYFLQALEARRRAAWHYGTELNYLNLSCLASLNSDKFIAREHALDALRLVSDDLNSANLNLPNDAKFLKQIWSPSLARSSFDGTAACMLIKAAIEAGDFDACRKIETLVADSSFLRIGTIKFSLELLPVLDTYATLDRGEDALRILSAVPDGIPVNATTLAKVVQVLPTNLKQKLFETHPTSGGDLRPVEHALAMRGWTKDAEKWMLKSVERIAPDQAETRQLSLARFYLNRKNFEQSRTIYGDVLGRLSKLTDGNVSSARTCIRSSDSILSDLSENRVSWPDIQKSAESIRERACKRLGVLQCLHLANELSKTGWQLEVGGKKESALKMYSSAFQISVKNLGPKDQETITRQLDAARVEGSLGKVQDASDQFEAALAILRKQKSSSIDTLKSALQNYADLLRRTDQHAKADAIYDELRRIDSSNKSRQDSLSKRASKAVMGPQLMITVNLFKGSTAADRTKRLLYEFDNPDRELQAWLYWQRVFEKELLSRLRKNKSPNVVSSGCHISFVVGCNRRVSNIKVIQGDADSMWTRRAERAIKIASGKTFLEFPRETNAKERPLVAKVDIWQVSRLHKEY